MAALDATDVSITINSRTTIGASGGRVRMNDVSITWGNGTDTYPSGGIPLPASSGSFHEDFGFTSSLGVVIISEALVEPGFVYHYDRTNHKFIVYESGTASAILDERDTADVPADGTGVRCLVFGY